MTDAIYDNYSLSNNTSSPLTQINSIGYNGLYWIAVGEEVVKSVLVNTHNDALQYETDAYLKDFQINSNKYQLTRFKQWVYSRNPPQNDYIYTQISSAETGIETYTNDKNYLLAKSRFLYKNYNELNYQKTLQSVYSLHCMVKSIDGRIWTPIIDNPFSQNSRVASGYQIPAISGSVRDIAWNGSKWMAVGAGTGNCVSMSSDGDVWTRHAGPSFNINEDTSREIYNGVACSSSLWIIVGRLSKDINRYGCVCKSTNGVEWDLCVTPMSNGTAIAYNGALWVAVGGRNSNTEHPGMLITSSDGINWTSRIGQSAFADRGYLVEFKSVAWNGSNWMATGTYNYSNVSVGGFIAKSTDGIEWTILHDNPFFSKCVWDGNMWILVGNTTYTTKDGISWSHTDKAGTSITAIGTTVVLPILGGTINNVSSLVVGYGQPSCILRSYDSITWRPQIIAGIGSLQREIYGVLWTGTNWAIIGNAERGYVGRAISLSSNGIDWTFPTSHIQSGRGIAWNGSMYVAVGGNSIFNGTKIETSSDGVNWIERVCPINTPKCVAGNSSIWVIGGDGGIITSTNGVTWTLSLICPLQTVNCIAWNGYIWIAMGKGLTNTIATSVDGIRWYSNNLTSQIFTEGKYTAWNKSLWVAVGTGNNTIATSVDGVNWIGQGNITFTSTGNYVGWDGVKWISAGIGGNTLVYSSDGNTWTMSDVLLEVVDCYANKNILLPYTGVSSNTILNKLLGNVQSITDSTGITLAQEQAAIDLAADQAAAAAALVLRNASKNSATTLRNHFINLNNEITNDNRLSSNVIINTSLYYSSADSAYNFFKNQIIVVESLYNIIYNNSNSQNILNKAVANLTSINTIANTIAIDFYEAKRHIYKLILAEVYDIYSNTSVLNMISNYGSTTLTNFYNVKLNGLLGKVNIANITFDTEVTTVNNLPHLSSIYDSIIYVNINETRPSTYLTDNSNCFTYLISIKGLYERDVFPFKTKCDIYYAKALEEAGHWATISNTTFNSQTITNQFNQLYNTYFYTFDTLLLPTNRSKLSTIVKLFQGLYEDFAHPGNYTTEFGTLFQTLKNSLNSITTTKNNAITYVNTKIDTTIKNKLNEFKTTTKSEFNGVLSINNHLKTLLSNTYYSNSIYQTSTHYAFTIGLGSLIYSTLFPFIRNIRISDIEAELDGCTPPVTGWGTTQNNLPVGQRGTQGNSGWDKFNETYYTRQRLANHIISHNNVNGFVNPIQYGINYSQLPINEAVTWKDFLNFTNTVTYTDIISKTNEFNTAISQLVNNGMFLNSTIDAIITTDLASIQSQIIPTVTAYLTNLVHDVTENLPSEQDRIAYGSVAFEGITLQQYYNTISTNFTTLQNLASTSLTGKTNEEIIVIINNAVATKTILNTTQKSRNYISFLDEISGYKSNVIYITNYVSTFEEHVARWMNMKQQADINSPYPLSITNGVGVQFIMSIIPTDTNYWRQRTYTIFIREDTGEKLECTFNSQTNSIATLPAYNPSNFLTYSATSTYINADFVAYNGSVYQCIKDNTPSVASNGIVGITPIDIRKWKLRKYPYVDIKDKFGIEASPENISLLDPANFIEYVDNWLYSQNSYVSYGNLVYRCISDQYVKKNIVGILPTNKAYWIEQNYKWVLYNNVLIEASPSNLPILVVSTFPIYQYDRVYLSESIVKYTLNFIFKDLRTNITYNPGSYVFYLEDDLQNQIKGVSGIVPIQYVSSYGMYVTTQRWRLINYPLVKDQNSIIEATPGTFTQLSLNDYSSYSDQTKYINENIVKYQNKIYRCAISVQGIIGVPVSNSDVWVNVKYPIVKTNNIEFEAVPGMINQLNKNDYNNYSSNKSYVIGNIIQYENSIYECIDDSQTDVPIINILPTTTTYWKLRRYPTVYVNGISIEANPTDISFFKQLNPLSITKYDNNWTYNTGDLAAYNGSVYECINTTPIHSVKYITNIDPSNSSYWTNDTSFTHTITSWTSGKIYSLKNYVVFDGYVYRCETDHISLKDSPPNKVPYSWRKIEDYSEVDLSDWYSESMQYIINRIVTYRLAVPNLQFNQTHILAKYKCTQLSITEPKLYTFDEVRMLNEEDGNGNVLYTKIDGSWNKRDVRRYGRADIDPFRLLGYPRETRRRIAMEIEMPYSQALKIYSEIESNRLNNDTLTTFEFGFPSKYPGATSLNNSLVSRTMTAYNLFKPHSTPTFYHNFLTSAYQNIVTLLDLRRTTINEILNGTGTDGRGGVNIIKQQYFHAIESRIIQNPYKYMSEIALAQDPPQKLYKDIGVGEINDITYHLDILKDGKYSEFDRTYYNENSQKIDNLQDLAGGISFESKRLIGYTTLFNMISSGIMMGGYVRCDSCILNVPIVTEQNYLFSFVDAYAIDPVQQINGTIMYSMNQLLDTSLQPPEYTLPSSRSASNLLNLTWESNNPFVQGLSSVAKGLVGITVSAFQNFLTGASPLVALISLVAGIDYLVQRARDKDNPSSAIQAVTAINFATFQTNTQSILLLRQQAAIYKRILINHKQSNATVETLGSLLDGFGVLLMVYDELVSDTSKIVQNINIIDFSTSTQIPTKIVNKFDFLDPIKPDAPEFTALKSLEEFKRTRDQIKTNIKDIKNQIRSLNGQPPSGEHFVKPILEFEITNIQSTTPPPSKQSGKNFPGQKRLLDIQATDQRSPITSNERKSERIRLESEKIQWENAKPAGESSVKFTGKNGVPIAPEKIPINQAGYDKLLEMYNTDLVVFETTKIKYQQQQIKKTLLLEKLYVDRAEKTKIDKILTELEDTNKLTQIQNDELISSYSKDIGNWKDTVKSQKLNYYREIAKQTRLKNEMLRTTQKIQLQNLATQVAIQDGVIQSSKSTFLDGVQTLEAKIVVYEDQIVKSTVFRDFITDWLPVTSERYTAVINKLTVLTNPVEIRLRSMISRIRILPSLRINLIYYIAGRPALGKSIRSMLLMLKIYSGGSKVGFLGRTLEVAGVVMGAIAGGAFETTARLDDPLGALETDYNTDGY